MEHIWPRSLGGDLVGSFFETSGVCKRCNEVMGQWVDAAFTKNCFVQNARAALAMRFLEPERPKIVPFQFLGYQENVVLGSEEVCERWRGPADEHVYWFHERDDPRWFGYAGGDFFRRRRQDPGRAYLALTAKNDYWALMALVSFIDQFGETERFMLTEVEGLPPALMAILPPVAQRNDERHAAFLKWYDERLEQRTHRTTGHLQVRIDFDHRFAAKFAFELGYKLLGEDYLKTAYAQKLRIIARERDFQVRLGHGMRGQAFVDHADNRFERVLAWNLAWVIVISTHNGGLDVSAHLPTGRSVTVLITDEPDRFENQLRFIENGLAVILVPSEQIAVGPLPIEQYLAHRLGRSSHPDLQQIELRAADPGQLPPKEMATP